MNQKYRFGLLAGSFVLLIMISAAYQLQYRYQAQDEHLENATEKEKESSPSVAAEGEAVKGELYYLTEKNGYVVVYQSDRQTVYEYTNISLSDLPEEVQNEVKKGKLIDTNEKLYGFLENYSS